MYPIYSSLPETLRQLLQAQNQKVSICYNLVWLNQIEVFKLQNENYLSLNPLFFIYLPKILVRGDQKDQYCSLRGRNNKYLPDRCN